MPIYVYLYQSSVGDDTDAEQPVLDEQSSHLPNKRLVV